MTKAIHHPSISLNGPLSATPLKASGHNLNGAVRAPGDKSISHRSLILGAMSSGTTSVNGLLEGDDVLRTAVAMRAFGARIRRDLTAEGPSWSITGAPWKSPEKTLFFGNAGTGSRLVMGAAAGAGVAAQFDGDGSLRARPMARIIEPLTDMGARFETLNGRLPLALLPGKALAAIDYTLPKPSAQIKSAILLAALGATGETVIREPERCRDHTERMLPAFGVHIEVTAAGGSSVIRLAGGQSLVGTALTVPGDPSSAAFFAAAAAIVPGSEILIENVLLNPTRTGFFTTLFEMGADIAFENEHDAAGEPVGDIRVRGGRTLSGVAVPASRAPSMIDEYPILSVVAAFADGDTYMPGIEELRVKESDRIAASEAMLQANGVETDSGPDWLRVVGKGLAEGAAGGGRVAARGDHRIAMSALVMGLAARNPVSIDDGSMIATSFPGFADDIARLGGSISGIPAH